MLKWKRSAEGSYTQQPRAKWKQPVLFRIPVTAPELLMGDSNTSHAELPRVTILLVNWNGSGLLRDCLSALHRQNYANLEPVVVDNGSMDDSVELTQKLFSHVKLVELQQNRGFTGGNIAGLEQARGEFIALINNDTRADEHWLENLLQPMLNDPKIGICASKLVFAGTGRINGAGDGVTTAGIGFNRGLNRKATEFATAEFVFGACGAALLYRRKMLEEIGFLDDDFFLYDEDTDLNFRAQLAGWKCAYVPTAVVHHIGNASAGRLSDAHIYYHTRNLEFVWIKNMPLALMVRFAHHKVVQEIGSFFYLCLRHGKWRPYFRAKRDAFRMLPKMWRKRREIQASRRVPNSYIRSMLTSMFTLDFVRRKIMQLIDG